MTSSTALLKSNDTTLGERAYLSSVSYGDIITGGTYSYYKSEGVLMLPNKRENEAWSWTVNLSSAVKPKLPSFTLEILQRSIRSFLDEAETLTHTREKLWGNWAVVPPDSCLQSCKPNWDHLLSFVGQIQKRGCYRPAPEEENHHWLVEINAPIYSALCWLGQMLSHTAFNL